MKFDTAVKERANQRVQEKLRVFKHEVVLATRKLIGESGGCEACSHYFRVCNTYQEAIDASKMRRGLLDLPDEQVRHKRDA